MTTINASDDIINASDVITRYEELEETLQELEEAAQDAETPEQEEQAIKELLEWKQGYDFEEMQELKDFYKSIQAYCNKDDVLINENHFPVYIKQFEIDCSENDYNAWPLNCINWEEAAEEVRSDYTAIEWDGYTFYVG